MSISVYAVHWYFVSDVLNFGVEFLEVFTIVGEVICFLNYYITSKITLAGWIHGYNIFKFIC